MKKFIKRASIIAYMILAGTSEHALCSQESGLKFLNSAINNTESKISGLTTDQNVLETLSNTTGLSQIQLDKYHKIGTDLRELQQERVALSALRRSNPEFIQQVLAQRNLEGNRFIAIGSGLIVASACIGFGVTKVYNLTSDNQETENSHPIAHKIVDGAGIASGIGLAALIFGLLVKSDRRV